MDRNYLVFRILELIHEVTGVWLDDDSPLDFESDHEWHVYNVWFRLNDEFLCLDYEQAKKWRSVKDIVRDCEEGLDDEG